MKGADWLILAFCILLGIFLIGVVFYQQGRNDVYQEICENKGGNIAKTERVICLSREGEIDIGVKNEERTR